MILRLRNKITCLTILAALLPLLTMLIAVAVERPRVKEEIYNDIVEGYEDYTRQVAVDIYNMCKITDKMAQHQLDISLDTGRHILETKGQANLLEDDKVTWLASNQSSPGSKPEKIELPKMVFDKNWLGQNVDLKKPTAIVDEIKERTGATTTIFQKMDDGSMLRIATNVEVPDPGNPGQKLRAIGTYIPRIEPDKKVNEVIQTVMAGGIYRGQAEVTGIPFVTRYEPIYDAGHEIIGMFFVGIPLDSITALKEIIEKTKVGDVGRVSVIRGVGPHKGVYIISGKESYVGKNSMLDPQTGEKRDFVVKLINEALAEASNGSQEPKAFNMIYPFEGQQKLSGITYFKPWDWIIVAGVYESDFDDAVIFAESSLNRLTAVLAGGFGVLLAVSIGAMIMGRRIARPISKITTVAQAVASGNLQSAAEMVGKKNGYITNDSCCRLKDETGQLVQAVSVMTENLNSLVGRVKQTSVQLLSSATEIAATSRQQEGNLSDLGSSTSEIAASVTQISSTSQELVKTMNQVTEVAEGTVKLANEGQAGIDGMLSGIRDLGGATQSISSKLAAINDKANNINAIVTTINKVADQTNLLSLNAAIEAEKAGEHGLGFSVVAREIRRLADQTAVATLDIEKMVKEMQAAVSSGVMEMDKFSEVMRVGLDRTGSIGVQMEQIISQVADLLPRFQTVRDGMKSQSQGAQQINDAMMQLTEGTRNAIDSLREFNKTTDFMRDAVRGLGDEISRFQVSE